MPTELKIDKKDGIIYRTISGNISVEDLISSYNQAFTHPDFYPGIKAITDIRKVHPYSLKEDVPKLTDFVHLNKKVIGSMRLAIISPPEPNFGILRLLQSYLEESTVTLGIFHTMEEAKKWLNKPAWSKSIA